jgi:hypothetical protein
VYMKATGGDRARYVRLPTESVESLVDNPMRK